MQGKKTTIHDKQAFLEASGRINEKTVLDYAKTGVDIISMGCLTSGIQSLDMSLRIVG